MIPKNRFWMHDSEKCIEGIFSPTQHPSLQSVFLNMWESPTQSPLPVRLHYGVKPWQPLWGCSDPHQQYCWCKSEPPCVGGKRLRRENRIWQKPPLLFPPPLGPDQDSEKRCFFTGNVSASREGSRQATSNTGHSWKWAPHGNGLVFQALQPHFCKWRDLGAC